MRRSSSHRDIDMVSFTGSTRAGTEVAKNAAASVKRVHQELGGKSPNVLLDDADFERAVKQSVLHVFQNSGQSCNAPTRMLVPAAKLAEVEAIAKRITATVVVGDPDVGKDHGGSRWFRNCNSIASRDTSRKALPRARSSSPAARAGRREWPRATSSSPRSFPGVRNDMTIAREEIFGPVLCILPYETEEQAVQIANDTPYGLAAYVWSQDNVRARRVGRPHPRGTSGAERRLGRHEDTVWRLQDVGQRARIRRIRAARLPGGQGRDRRRRRLILKDVVAEYAVLRLENLSKRYRQDRPAIFERLDLELRRGEYLAIMGESGVGKSTLLNLLAGLDQPDSGRVWLEGADLSRMDDDANTLLRRRCVGFVFQAFHVLPYLTVEQNIALPLELLGVAEPERAQRTAQMLEAVGISAAGASLPARACPAASCSASRSRRALVHRPRLVLADEPTGNLDPRSAAQILALLRDQVKANAGAGILITHSRTAADTADRILVLDAQGLKPLRPAV